MYLYVCQFLSICIHVYVHIYVRVYVYVIYVWVALYFIVMKQPEL